MVGTVIAPRHTRIVMWVLIALAITWELVAVTLGQHATISEWFWSLCSEPIFVFAFGLLAGHLVWQRDNCVNCGKSPIRKEP